jgi:hypothetical protein
VKRTMVKGFIIKSAVFPAPVENTDPLERQRADCCVVVHPSRTDLLVVGVRPRRPEPRICGELMEGLAQQLGTRHAGVNATCLAAVLNHRGNSGEALDLVRVLIVAAIGAKGHEKPGRQDFARRGEAIEELVVGCSRNKP